VGKAISQAVIEEPPHPVTSGKLHREGRQQTTKACYALLYHTFGVIASLHLKGNHMNREKTAAAEAAEQLRRCKHGFLPHSRELDVLRYFVLMCRKWAEDPALEAVMLYEFGIMQGIRKERQRRAKRGGGDRGKN
jgi:hypothetical protein